MFEGFSPETIDFLWGIRFNNNRDWFQEHKADYQRTLFEPMKALAAEVAAAFSDVDDLKMHVSRIYRDMRMHPATFYKESLWFCLRRPGGEWLTHPCLCFEIAPEHYSYGFLLWGPKAAQMELLRQRMLEKPDAFLKLVKKAEAQSGIALEGTPYARPKPCEDKRLAPYFGRKNMLAIRECPPDDLLYSPQLAGELIRVLRAWLPVYTFCLSTE